MKEFVFALSFLNRLGAGEEWGWWWGGGGGGGSLLSINSLPALLPITARSGFQIVHSILCMLKHTNFLCQCWFVEGASVSSISLCSNPTPTLTNTRHWWHTCRLIKLFQGELLMPFLQWHFLVQVQPGFITPSPLLSPPEKHVSLVDADGKCMVQVVNSALCYCTAELLSSRRRPSSVVRRRQSAHRPSVRIHRFLGNRQVDWRRRTTDDGRLRDDSSSAVQ